MNQYITGAVIRKLREAKKMTQEALAEKIFVSSKAVSKWETGQGFPDISLIEPLAKALDISVIELLSGQPVCNSNRAGNMFRSQYYVCPLCGNVIHSIGAAVVSCCGITLPPLEAETPDEEHMIHCERVEDEYYITLNHPMDKDHYISFLAAVSDSGLQFIKLYPQGAAEARVKRSGVRYLYACCNRHGLFCVKPSVRPSAQ